MVYHLIVLEETHLEIGFYNKKVQVASVALELSIDLEEEDQIAVSALDMLSDSQVTKQMLISNLSKRTNIKMYLRSYTQRWRILEKVALQL